MTEHGLLIRILLIYRHLLTGQASGQPVPAGHAHDSALIIHDYIEAFHEELEEAYVFPRLMRAGQLKQTVSTLLLQHARGRELTQLILRERRQRIARDGGGRPGGERNKRLRADVRTARGPRGHRRVPGLPESFEAGRDRRPRPAIRGIARRAVRQ